MLTASEALVAATTALTETPAPAVNLPPKPSFDALPEASATAFALQTVRALMLDEIGKLYVTAAAARGGSGSKLLWRYPAKHSLGPVINSLGFDLNRIFNELPIVALILTLTEAGALLFESLARSNDQQLAGAIIFLLTASIVALNFATDILLALIDPRVRQGASA